MTLDAKWVDPDYSKYADVRRNLTLGDNIDLNVYVSIKDGTSGNDYTVNAEYVDANGKVTSKIGVLSEVTEKLDDGRYKFSFSPAAKEMNNIVSVKVQYKGKAACEDKEFSVRDYCEVYAEARATDVKTVNLCKAILDFGAYTQKYFNYDVENLANRNLSSDAVENTAVPETLRKITDVCTGIDKAASNMNLVSALEMNVFFYANGTASEETMKNYRFTVDGAEATAAVSNNRYVVNMAGILAKDLGNMHEFRITNRNDGSTLTVTDSPVAYLYRVYSTSNDINYVHLASAIYLYNQAAIAFFA